MNTEPQNEAENVSMTMADDEWFSSVEQERPEHEADDSLGVISQSREMSLTGTCNRLFFDCVP